MHKIMAQRGNNDFFSDNENFEQGPPRHAGGNGNQSINFVWPYCTAACATYIHNNVVMGRIHNVKLGRGYLRSGGGGGGGHGL